MTSFWRALLFLFLSVEALYGCKDMELCEHKKYGHRRALLNSPALEILKPDGTKTSCNYQNYFERIETSALELRSHLIREGAFETAELEKSEKLIRKSTLGSQGNKGTIEEKVKVELEKAENRDLCQQKDKKDTRSPEEILQSKVSEFTSLAQKFYRKSEDSIASQELNVASFGFVFFDEEGCPLNEPFHFSPEATSDTLEDPFFFFSGRRHRSYKQEDEPNAWTALSESAPKSSDLSLLPDGLHSSFSPSNFKEAFNSILGPSHLSTMQRSLEGLQRFYEDFKISMKDILLEKSEKEPFFEYIRQRKERRVIKKEVCGDFLELLSLPVSQISTEKKKDFFYPSDPKKEDKNKEGDFTHSEQYALFKMSQTIDDFLDVSLQKISQKGKDQKIGSYAVLIYTYNVMCIRCVQSVIVDFVHTGDGQGSLGPFDSFSEKINKKLRQFMQEQDHDKTYPLSFMAGYTRSYTSPLKPEYFDDFERWLKHPQEISLAFDETLYPNQGQWGYNFCPFDMSSEMIYHFNIKGLSTTERSLFDQSPSRPSWQDIQFNHNERKKVVPIYGNKPGYYEAGKDIEEDEAGKKYIEVIFREDSDSFFHIFEISRKDFVEKLCKYIKEEEDRKITHPLQDFINYQNYIKAFVSDLKERIGNQVVWKNLKAHFIQKGLTQENGKLAKDVSLLSDKDFEGTKLTFLQQEYVKYVVQFENASFQEKQKILEAFYITHKERFDFSSLPFVAPILGFKAQVFQKNPVSKKLNLYIQIESMDAMDALPLHWLMYVNRNHYNRLHPLS